MAVPQLDEEAIFNIGRRIETPDLRRAYLQQACGDNEVFLARVEALLRVHEQEHGLLRTAAPSDDIAEKATECPGTLIGPYKLKEQIGEGGMGLVFVAEQSQPVRRKVALKLIKPGMDSRQVIARFEAERQALALMNHANIAKVFDGGETPSGRPYFVMELVKGVPITEYCDQNRLTTRARLELFGQVCAAVQHAHQKGIIHRDIKPTNVMVVSHDGTPVVKVIDFGVAKAIGQQLTDKSVYTHFSQFIGTPLYMSPEQAGQSGLDIDTRTDIYALGVLLYELLTGTTPFDKERLASASYDEIRRLIREEEPPKPSTRMSTVGQAGSTISAQRQTNPQHLCLLLRGELDWIVMKALEKDRNRRYESASALAADIERHLKDEPVQACPPSRRYLLGKFLRRHRTGVLTTSTLLMMALLFGAGAGWIALDKAARRINTEQAVEDDLKEAQKHQQHEQWADVRQALERARGRLAGSGLDSHRAKVNERRRELDLITQLEEARMKAVALAPDFNRDEPFIASDRAYVAAFTALDLDVTALPAEEAARRIRASAIHSQLVSALDHWAYVKGRMPKANVEPLRTVAQLVDDNEWRRRLRDPKVANDREKLKHLAEEDGVLDQPPASLLILSSLLKTKGTSSDALQLLRRAQRRYPADFRINFDLGMMLSFNSLNLEAGAREAGAREAVGYFRAALALQPQSPHVYIHLADAIGTQGLEHEPEAQEACRKAIALKPDYAEAYFFLGNGLWNEKKAPEAEKMFRKVVDLEPHNVRALAMLVKVLRAQEKLSEVVALKEQWLESLKDKSRSVHDATFNAESAATLHNHLGVALETEGQLHDAIATFREAIRLEREFMPAHFNLGMALSKKGEIDEAITEYREAIRLKPEHMPAHLNMGITLSEKGQIDDAITAYREAIRLEPEHMSAHLYLGIALSEKGQIDEAIAAYREAIRLEPNNARPHWILSELFTINGRPVEAIAAAHDAVRLGPNDPDTHFRLGVAFRRGGQPVKAIASYRESLRLASNSNGAKITIGNAIGNALVDMGQVDEAILAYEDVLRLAPRFKAARYGLGYAHSRKGRLKDAIAAYRQALELKLGASDIEVLTFAMKVQGESGIDSFFLAIVYGQLGKKDEARARFDKGIEWMQSRGLADADLDGFRAEAAAMLGLAEAEMKK